MKVEQKGHTVIIKDTQADVKAFLGKITAEHNNYKEQNIILDVSQDNGISLDVLLSFLPLSNKHRKAKKSFVMVASDIEYSDVPDEMVVVPTLLEAHDIIEMEEIERDLGF